MDSFFGQDFEAELAAIDAALAPDAETARKRLLAETEALRKRYLVATVQGKMNLIDRIGQMIQAREAASKHLDGFLSEVQAARVIAPNQANPSQNSQAEPRPMLVPGMLPVGGKQKASRVAPISAIPPRAQPLLLPATPPTADGGPVATAISVPRPEAPSEAAANEAQPATRINAKAAIRAGQEFMRREREFLDDPTWDRVREAELKALVCEGRAIEEMQRTAGTLDTSLIRDSIELLQERFNDAKGDAPFFAFNPQRSHSHETWQSLSEGFNALALAQQCMDWLEGQENLPDELEEILGLAAAAEAWIHRLNEDKGLEFVDEQQREIHRRIEALAQEYGFYIRWWNLNDYKVTTEAIAKEASKLGGRFRNLQTRHESKLKKEGTLLALTGLVSSLKDDGDLEKTLVPAILRCLEAGVQPSKKELVEACLPYRAFLADLEHPGLRRLVEALNLEKMRLQRKNQPEPEDPDEDEGPQDTLLAEVREHLKGKTVLFVGGRCLPQKQQEIMQALGVDLLWPDAEPDTLINQFTASTLRADVVCYLIRWSRHSYKLVLDHAKRLGKETVTIKAGLGLNRFVHDVHDQLLARRTLA